MGWDLLSTCVSSVEVVGSWEPCTPFPSFRHSKMSPEFHLPLKSVLLYTFRPNHEISSSFSIFFFRRPCCSRHYIRRPFLTKYLDVNFDLFDEKMSGFMCLCAFLKRNNQFARFARHFCRLPGTFTISTGLTCAQCKNFLVILAVLHIQRVSQKSWSLLEPRCTCSITGSPCNWQSQPDLKEPVSGNRFLVFSY